jgi:hypothetical protein
MQFLSLINWLKNESQIGSDLFQIKQMEVSLQGARPIELERDGKRSATSYQQLGVFLCGEDEQGNLDVLVPLSIHGCDQQGTR